jgi:hypothetical protein
MLHSTSSFLTFSANIRQGRKDFAGTNTPAYWCETKKKVFARLTPVAMSYLKMGAILFSRLICLELACPDKLLKRFWLPCYKTFYVRNLSVFKIS